MMEGATLTVSLFWLTLFAAVVSGTLFGFAIAAARELGADFLAVSAAVLLGGTTTILTGLTIGVGVVAF
jgi:hypothetical protein